MATTTPKGPSASAPPRRVASTSIRPSLINGRTPPRRMHSAPLPNSQFSGSEPHSIRHHVTFSERKFDVTTLPNDLMRVYTELAEDFGEEYGLTFVFTVRTAVELHRAWHMTLLTSKILQQIKDKFELKMTWNLGVIALKFRVEDGRFELHRKVPYDYDSEFQDLYMKIAVALVEGHINVHEALIFQSETKQGKHTARSGKFLRDNPGRLVLYPLQAATCAVIFFGGDWLDAGVAATCGLSAGLVEYCLSAYSSLPGAGDVKILIDVMCGVTTGLVGGLFYRFHSDGDTLCLSSIFLGTLYWFFYGTAFVIGLLEIIAGELETGVTRFIAVSVKTFVLTLGSSIGLQMALAGHDASVFDSWNEQFIKTNDISNDICNNIDLDTKWWRIPLYLLCSASALGQYRFPIANYWRGLVVQLVGYEVQYQMFKYFAEKHNRDFLDTASSNIAGAAAAVVAASILSYIVDESTYYYNARLLQRTVKTKHSIFGNCIYSMTSAWVRLTSGLGIGSKNSLRALEMEQKLKDNVKELKDPHHPRRNIILTPEEEIVLVEAIVEAEDLNIWSLLMPAVYQLVPGSMIARLWYNAIFPPTLVTTEKAIVGSDLIYTDVAANPIADDVFYGLWVISTSLALGLLLGFALVQLVASILMFTYEMMLKCCPREEQSEEERAEEEAKLRRMRFRQQGVLKLDIGDDPSENLGEGGDGVIVETTAVVPLAENTSDSTGSAVQLSPLHCGVLVPLSEENGDIEGNDATIPTIAKMQMEKAEDEGFEVPEHV